MRFPCHGTLPPTRLADFLATASIRDVVATMIMFGTISHINLNIGIIVIQASDPCNHIQNCKLGSQSEHHPCLQRGRVLER